MANTFMNAKQMEEMERKGGISTLAIASVAANDAQDLPQRGFKDVMSDAEELYNRIVGKGN